MWIKCIGPCKAIGIPCGPITKQIWAKGAVLGFKKTANPRVKGRTQQQENNPQELHVFEHPVILVIFIFFTVATAYLTFLMFPH